MFEISHRSVFRLVITMAVVISMQLSAIRISMSHLPNQIEAAELTRHSQLTSPQNMHGHSHYDGEVEEQRSGHNHGHDAADHSHEMLYKVSYLFLSKPTLVKNWEISPPVFAELETLYTIEHPPRKIFFN